MSQPNRVVPNVVGLTFVEARALVSKFGWTLANPDPDGPPITHLIAIDDLIRRQEPAANSRNAPSDSIAVWLEPPQPMHVRRSDIPPLSTLFAHAKADDAQHSVTPSAST